MRPLEILIPFLLAIYLLWPNSRPKIIQFMPLTALVITFAHLIMEGYRWQMIPLYGCTLLLTLTSLIKITGNKDWSRRTSILMLIPLAISTALPILLPVPKIQAPSGPFEVGTVNYEFTDTTRKELYSGKDESRKLMVQVWYPAEVTSTAKHAQWMSEATIYAPAIAGFLRLPSFFLDHLALSISPAYLEVPIAKNKTPFPVILFSHGWKGFNAQNTGQAVELASHGFVVIAPQYPYGAIITVFPDGTIAPNNPDALPENDKDPNYEVIARKLVNQWVGDTAFVLDQFQGFDQETGNLFFQKLDFQRVGAYGHSTGGGAAIQFCAVDSRCKAVLGMDPFMRPVCTAVIQQGISQPSFFMFTYTYSVNA